jgi:hypothetical protein
MKMNAESKALRDMIKEANENKNFNDINEALSHRLSKISNAKKICSFDIEFTNKDCTTATEIGFVVYDTKSNTFRARHLIIQDQIGKYTRKHTPIDHSEMFSYGKSDVVTLDIALTLLQIAIAESEALIIYADTGKKEYLNSKKLIYRCREMISMQDLLCIKNRIVKSVSLLQIVFNYSELNHITEQPVNNAGNDAVTAFDVLRVDFDFNDTFKINIVNDYSNDSRKLLAYDLWSDRRRK